MIGDWVLITLIYIKIYKYKNDRLKSSINNNKKDLHDSLLLPTLASSFL
jgi:hypothetical protein